MRVINPFSWLALHQTAPRAIARWDNRSSISAPVKQRVLHRVPGWGDRSFTVPMQDGTIHDSPVID